MNASIPSSAFIPTPRALVRHIAYVLVNDDDEVLVLQNAGGEWELPRERQLPGESDAMTLRRLVAQVLDQCFTTGPETFHHVPGAGISLSGYWARCHEARSYDGEDAVTIQWRKPAELKESACAKGVPEILAAWEARSIGQSR